MLCAWWTQSVARSVAFIARARANLCWALADACGPSPPAKYAYLRHLVFCCLAGAWSAYCRRTIQDYAPQGDSRGLLLARGPLDARRYVVGSKLFTAHGGSACKHRRGLTMPVGRCNALHQPCCSGHEGRSESRPGFLGDRGKQQPRTTRQLRPARTNQRDMSAANERATAPELAN